MYINNGKGSLIRLIAGLLILASVLLGKYVSEYFLIFTGFIGFMFMVSALTGFCPMYYMLKALGVEDKTERCSC